MGMVKHFDDVWVIHTFRLRLFLFEISLALELNRSEIELSLHTSYLMNRPSLRLHERVLDHLAPTFFLWASISDLRES